jgi:NhaP-type Na+/H+ or K+/H+ antiporter
MSQEQSEVMSNGVLVILGSCIIVMTLAQLVKDRVKWVQEATISIVIGILIGGIIYLARNSSLNLATIYNIQFFLVILIPPIIFEKAYNLEKVIIIQKSFFKHLGATLIFAIFGTLVSTVSVFCILYPISSLFTASLTYSQALAFAALISATEPGSLLPILKELNIENKILYLLSDESKVNQIVAVSLYSAIIKTSDVEVLGEMIGLSLANFLLIFIGSLVIGVTIAAAISYVLSKLQIQFRFNVEACLIMFSPWIAYLLANIAGLSGLVSILMCGIFMARYSFPNLDFMTKGVVGKVYSVVAYCAEVIIYLLLGITIVIFKLTSSTENIAILCIAFLAAIISRVICVFLSANLLNLCTHQKLGWRTQILIGLTGMRGAVSFFLATQVRSDLESGDLIMMISVIFILTNKLILSTAVPLLVPHLNITQQSNQNPKILLVGEDTNENCFMRVKRSILGMDDYLYHCLVRESKEMSCHANSDRSQFVTQNLELKYMTS